MTFFRNKRAAEFALAVALMLWLIPVATAKMTNQRILVQGNTAFALNLYAKLKAVKGNIIFSPYGVSTAMAMTYAGAAGKTKAQMKRALGFGLPPLLLHPTFKELGRSLTVGQKTGVWQLFIANALWPQRGYRFQARFLNLITANYGFRILPQNFRANPPRAVLNINRWVDHQTKGKIKKLLRPKDVTTSTRLVLTGAVYFKGAWMKRFDPRLTVKRPFFITPQKSVTVRMMRLAAKLRYAQTRELQVLELPYVGRALSMVILLPRRGRDISSWQKNLTPDNLCQWLRRLRLRKKVMVYLPRFKVTGRFDLAAKLSALGVRDAFGPQADFSAMTGRRDLFISKVIHQALVEVSEQGTEAAGASAVIVAKKNGGKRPPTFRADRPFIFLIRDRRSGSILFLGRLSRP